jgi:SagB-type dehydrogenase family enzyme
MRAKRLWLFVVLVGLSIGILMSGGQFFDKSSQGTAVEAWSTKLPEPRYEGEVSVEEAIFQRRSIRHYRDDPLTVDEVSQLLWAAGGKTIDGITGATRAYPSAGAAYPLEIYLAAGNVQGLPAGLYRYQWEDHSIVLVKDGDVRNSLTKAALGQSMVASAPISLVFAAVYARTTQRYGQRGEVRYVHMDVGGAGQNVHLQAEALGLGTVIIGAFRDEAVQEVLGVRDEEPLYIMPVGRL